MLFLLHQNTIQSGRQSRDMERRPSVVLLICSVVGLLGLVSAAAGLGAEATRVKGSEVELVSPTQCAYPQSATALGLGLTAVASLLIAHIILNVATGCGCYNNSIIAKTSSNNKTSSAIAIPIACFILSWFTFIVALFFLLTAAVLNERHGEDTVYNGNYYCYIVKPGVFAGGAVLSLTSVILGIIFFYYLTEPIASNSSFFPSQLLPSFTLPNHQPPVPAAAAPRGGSSMAVARPPPRDHEKSDRDHTVFVHEDTYMRRQFP